MPRRQILEIYFEGRHTNNNLEKSGPPTFPPILSGLVHILERAGVNWPGRSLRAELKLQTPWTASAR